MKDAGAFLKYFDKVLLIVAVVIAAGWIYLSVQVPFVLLDTADINSKLVRIKNWSSKGGEDVTFENEYTANAKRFADAAKADLPHYEASKWLSYLSPTPRPFKEVIVTPPPKQYPKISSVADLTGESVPGKVTLAWKIPPVITDLKLEGYYVFRTTPEVPFGSFSIEGKLKVDLGKGTKTDVPIAGPISDLTFVDSTIEADSKYCYIVVAFGFPGREVMKDGKVVKGADGEPKMERISDQPVAAVSQILEGRTVEESQIFLKGTVNGVAGNFLVYKWDRETATWLDSSIPNVPIGKQIGGIRKVNKVAYDFSTGWILKQIGKEFVEKDGKRRNLDYAILVSARNRAVTRKLFFEKDRSVIKKASQFTLSPISKGEKKN